MSCNGCRALRRGCTDDCVLRPCLEWIESPKAQTNAILFVSKFFGRTDLLSYISNVPLTKRPALFQSLLFEACGRTVNPVSGVIGLISTGNWYVCQQAVSDVLAGRTLSPIFAEVLIPHDEFPSDEAWKGFHINGGWRPLLPYSTTTFPSTVKQQPDYHLNLPEQACTMQPDQFQPIARDPILQISSPAVGNERFRIGIGSSDIAMSEVYRRIEEDINGGKGEEPKLLNLFV